MTQKDKTKQYNFKSYPVLRCCHPDIIGTYAYAHARDYNATRIMHLRRHVTHAAVRDGNVCKKVESVKYTTLQLFTIKKQAETQKFKKKYDYNVGRVGLSSSKTQ
jgi:hypothetical protein